MRLIFSTMTLLLISVFAWAQDSAPTENRLYGVIFQVTTGTSGKVEKLDIAKVIDPASWTTDPVDVEVPESFVLAAHNFLRDRTYPGSPKQFYTYIFYDPLQPERADIDPRAGRL
jgi:hypothetical protein